VQRSSYWSYIKAIEVQSLQYRKEELHSQTSIEG